MRPTVSIASGSDQVASTRRHPRDRPARKEGIPQPHSALQLPPGGGLRGDRHPLIAFRRPDLHWYCKHRGVRVSSRRGPRRPFGTQICYFRSLNIKLRSWVQLPQHRRDH
jgi:hypothetical protein